MCQEGIKNSDGSPLSMKSCAAWRSASSFSGVSSGPGGSRSGAVIPLRRWNKNKLSPDLTMKQGSAYLMDGKLTFLQLREGRVKELEVLAVRVRVRI